MIPQALKKTFFQDDGSLDEIVISATLFILTALALEFRTYWTPATGVVFSLKDFGEGVAACAIGFGGWWRLRDWNNNKPDTRPPTL